MENRKIKIVVSGDVCINSLLWRTHYPHDKRLSWQQFSQVHHRLITGEAHLLSKLVALATGITPLTPNLRSLNPFSEDGILVSSVELDRFPATSEEKKQA